VAILNFMCTTYMIFVMVFKTLQHGNGILANEGASPPGHQICTLYYIPLSFTRSSKHSDVKTMNSVETISCVIS
jgi:hypothetical protein